MSTALITGASSGIGYELAKIFAANKIDLILVARNAGKLSEISTELKSNYAIQVHVLAMDLSTYQNAKRVFDFCSERKLPVSYLVNNAGFGDYCLFANSSWEKLEQMINLNVTALTYLTGLFVPGMIAAKTGRVLNVASTAAFQPGPTMAVYFATKAYVLHFSEAIANELKGTGVTVTALCPGATESGFQDAALMHESKLVKGKKLPSSAEVALYGFQAMMKGKPVAIHGTLNYLMANSVRFLPRQLVTRLARWVQG